MKEVSLIKPILLAVLCTAMLGSCSETVMDDGKPLYDGRISFSATESKADINPLFSNAPASRVTADGTFETRDRFGVFACHLPEGKDMGQAVPDFMYNQPVTLTDGNWTYSPAKYWPAAGSLSFFAYYPYNAPGLTFSSNTATGYPVLYYDNTKADTDLLAAQTGAITRTDIPDGKISLAFKHLLTKVNIAFTYQGNANASGNDYRPMVHMIKYPIPTGGTYSYQGQDAALPSWTKVDATTTTLTRYTAAEGVFITREKQKIDEFTAYLLPTSIESFDVAINHVIVNYTPPTPVVITAGKEVTLNFTIASTADDASVFIASYTMWENGGEIIGDLQ